jgi:putative flavoprotein involved in K+ transport
MGERVDVVVIGGGQAGLATSHELTEAGIEHVVLERDRVGQSWRARWDSFCLVTPNWFVQLPAGHYHGDDPDGYMPRDQITGYLEAYARGFGAPVREGVQVTSLVMNPRGAFRLRTSAEEITASTVVVATGAYQRPHRPTVVGELSGEVHSMGVEAYRNPDRVPDGKVLIVGSGQSGCQLAEELHQAGREVFLAASRAPWSPRRIGGRDLVWWAVETGFLDMPVSALPDPKARLEANVLATGHGGGHDLHLRTLRAMGVTLLGHLVAVDGRRARFAPDLAESVAWGDERYARFRGLVLGLVEERGLTPVDMPDPEPFDASASEEIDLTGFGAVIFTSGFRPDYASWIKIPGAFDDLGFPNHRDGRSTAAPGLHFVGVHFLRKRKSSLLWGVGEDAGIVARSIAQERAPSRLPGPN